MVVASVGRHTGVWGEGGGVKPLLLAEVGGELRYQAPVSNPEVEILRAC